MFVQRTNFQNEMGEERATQRHIELGSSRETLQMLCILSLHLDSEPKEKVFKFPLNCTEVSDFHLLFFPLRTSEEYGCLILTYIINNHPHH